MGAPEGLLVSQGEFPARSEMTALDAPHLNVMSSEVDLPVRNNVGVEGGT